MKKYGFLLLLTFLFLCGCSKKEVDSALSKPPVLTVLCGEESVEALTGSFAWAVPQKDGTIAHVVADALHPLDTKELLTPLTIRPSTVSRVDPRTAYLVFDGPLPDRLEVYRWVDGPDDPYTVQLASQKVDMGERIYGFEIKLEEAYSIYEVCAQWGSSEREGGEVSYIFAAQLWVPEMQAIG